jgi:hypothetical protein
MTSMPILQWQMSMLPRLELNVWRPPKRAFKLATTCTNMEALLKSDVDALALFSQ